MVGSASESESESESELSSDEDSSSLDSSGVGSLTTFFDFLLAWTHEIKTGIPRRRWGLKIHTLTGSGAVTAAFLPSLATFFSTFLSALALAAAAGGADFDALAILIDVWVIWKCGGGGGVLIGKREMRQAAENALVLKFSRG